MKPQELTGRMGYGIQENMLLHNWQALHSDFLAVHMLCIPQLTKQAVAEGQNANTADVTYIQLACVATWALSEVLLC